MDTTDFTNQIQDQERIEQLNEDKRMDEEDHGFVPGNPIIDYSPQEELDRIGNREAYQAFRGF